MAQVVDVPLAYSEPYAPFKPSFFRATVDFHGQKQSFTVTVHNESGDWIDLVIDRPDGTALKTGHIQNGETGQIVDGPDGIGWYGGNTAKITRWAPGLFGVGGNGGGELTFIAPNGVIAMELDITVIKK